MKILVLDNYDSFTYNLVHLIRGLGCGYVDVARNDRITVGEAARYDTVFLSPGPGVPSEAGILTEFVRHCAPACGIFGVCLGMQAIGEVFGAGLVNLADVYHGVATPVNVIERVPLFDGLPERFEAGRYHSWAVAREGFPASLKITATDDDGLVMALSHRKYDVHGVQFHPESVLTPAGSKIVENFLKNRKK
jgi:anthranilate synthase component 2